jgi:hypothetical protein
VGPKATILDEAFLYLINFFNFYITFIYNFFSLLLRYNFIIFIVINLLEILFKIQLIFFIILFGKNIY